MIYLSSFRLPDRNVRNPNIYPYHVFCGKDIEPFVFAPVTVFYGNNGSGKSTLLNIIAGKLQLKGRELAAGNCFGTVNYCEQFERECRYSLGDEETGRRFQRIPAASRYIKSEDILYEIKKIQQAQVLADGMKYDLIQSGKSVREAEAFLNSPEGFRQQEYRKFAQEKYSNGETAMQFLGEYLVPDALYLLDEPEVSLSPQNQVKMAEEINKMARFLGCQFVIATHSPFMLGILKAKIYNLDTDGYEIQNWTELPNVRYFYDFFKSREREFGACQGTTHTV